MEMGVSSPFPPSSTAYPPFPPLSAPYLDDGLNGDKERIMVEMGVSSR